MKVLIACEESQAVTIEFRKLGIEAYSCDVKECTGGFPEWHIKGDALIEAYSGKYDLMIAHPPCTHLAVSGARHFKEKIKDGRQKASIEFFMKLANAPINHIVIENPICIMSKVWREPDQIIQPYYFGDEFQKTTTKIVSKGEFVTFSSGKRMSKWYAESFGDGTKRSKTFKGISEAMANQWKNLSKISIQQVLELK
jgi:site-specific DNA-cytosine methylase